ncbi:MAG: hypothetical protein IJX70_03735 [Clostridia bacterium]|nr:hypothetical protein [Clostridia bacterium]
MKTYLNPTVELIELSSEDVIVTSLTASATAFDFGSDAAGDIWSWNA